MTREPSHPHQAIIDRFSDYYDDEMTPPDREAFERYLERHPGARSEYEGFARSLELTHQLQMRFAPDDLAQKVTRRIHRQTRGRFFSDAFSCVASSVRARTSSSCVFLMRSRSCVCSVVSCRPCSCHCAARLSRCILSRSLCARLRSPRL